MSVSADSKCQEIEEYVKNKNTQDLSIRTIAKEGWLFSAKYLYILQLIQNGELPAVKLKSAKNPERFMYRVYYKDLEDYIHKISWGK